MASLRALIVEDGDLAARALARMLLKRDIVADIARDAPEARTLLAATRYAIVIADFGLPSSENGHDILRFVHETWPETRCILISASDLAPEQATGAWFSFLAKPFSAALLLNLISTTLIPPEKNDG